MLNVKMNVEGVEFMASARQAAALSILMETNKGGFARVHGYVAKSGYNTPEVADISFLSRFSMERLYQRRIAALQALTVEDIKGSVEKESKLKVMDSATLMQAFEDRKKVEIASLEKTLDGVRDDARRQAHDRCYTRICDGVKVHFLTETGEDGLKHPVLNDGLPMVESIMVNAIEVSRSVIQEGVYKPVNSGVPVLLSNAMAKVLPKSTKVKTLSLKSDNFDSLTIDGNAIMPADIAGDFT